MEPHTQQHTPQTQGRSPAPQDASVTSPTSRDAALNLLSRQIDALYDNPDAPPTNEMNVPDVVDNTPPASSTIELPDAYHQTHSNIDDIEAAVASDTVQEHWRQYHTQWQQYYQMYYERYYQSYLQTLVASSSLPETPKSATPTIQTPDQTYSQDTATNAIRSELLQKIKQSSRALTGRRHFKPALIALAVALVFGFLQYNQLLFANVMAFTIPASTQSTESYIDPSTDIAVSTDPILKIPAINVEAPVDYSLTNTEEAAVQDKLRFGVVHYAIDGANALPGEVGNTVILGHSANDVFADGRYKFIFLHLDRLQIGDKFYLNYQGKRYTYAVTEKKVIAPSEIDALAINNGKPMATLVTCTPVGTSLRRLLVIGEQIAPEPSKNATSSPVIITNDAPTKAIGGDTKGFFERLFGGN